MTSYEERQEEELEVLHSIYVNDLHDLRSKKTKWKVWHPLELKIRLRPQKSMTQNECHAELILRVSCGPRYPDTPPTLEVLHNKGVPTTAAQNLLIQLAEMAEKLKGEVMILNLCQHVQEYLVQFNQPRALSIYDEMVQNQRKQLEQLEEKQRALEAKEKEEQEKVIDQLAHQVRIRQEQVKEEARRRRANSTGHNDTRLSYSSDKSPDDSESSGASCKGHKVVQMKVTICGKERTLHRGSCMGHSPRGRIAFVAMDASSGDTFCLHEWVFTKKSLERSKTFELNPNQQMLLSDVDSQFGTLCRVQHPNLVRYFGIVQEFQKDKIAISILQELLTGHSPLKMHTSRGIPLDLQVVRSYCHDILKGLLHLHENNISHCCLSLSNVFISHQGIAKIADFGVVRKLDDLMRSLSGIDEPPKAFDVMKFDVYSLGLMLLALAQGSNICEDVAKIPSSFPSDFQDFLRKCLFRSENERWGTNQLLNHKFVIQKINYKPQSSNPSTSTSDLESLETDHAEGGAIATRSSNIPVSYDVLPNTSRLKTEFQFIEFVGSGGFGSVFKVQNKLDNREYAIKQILLEPSNRHLNRKINREVRLLSRLNHENVVRYFNSWVEIVELKADSESELGSSPKRSTSLSEMLNKVEPNFEAPPMADGSVEWSASASRVMPVNAAAVAESSSESSEDELFGIGHISESSAIMFEHSTKRSSSSEHDNADEVSQVNSACQVQYMFIQMEFCDKKTLRNAIDDALYKDPDRMWRLFREIIEGLVYIHQQGIIHRDLKPVNIFLDLHDHAKIGDFGLATTDRQLKPEEGDVVKSPDFGAESKTGKVGTALYTAPESGTGIIYTQKVDIYSLGVIFFEMCYPCTTKMERAGNLANIRLPEVKLPQDAEDLLSKQQIFLVQWLLHHDPTKRPTSVDLLSSDYLPPPVIEEAELNEMLRHTVSNRQSKTYKKLMTSLFSQHMDDVWEYTFDMDDIQNSDASLRNSAIFSYVREKIETIMKLHGAQNVYVPLLTPLTDQMEVDESTVELMDNQGSLVSIPHNTRIPFARYVARKGIPFIKRYTIDRVFRSRRIFGCHPKELFEASFDIVSANTDPDVRLPLMEVFSVVEEVLCQFAFPEKSDLGPYLRINHYGLIKSLLLYNGITDGKKQLKVIKLLRNRYMSRLRFQNELSDMNLNESCMNMISQFREVEDPMGKIITMYRSIVHNKSPAGAAAKDALEELDSVVTLLESISFKLPVVIVPCLVHDVSIYNTGLLFEVKLRCKSGQDVVAVGGCYDNLINRFRVRLARADVLPQYRAVGVSFTVDRLVKLAAEFDKISYVDSVVCTTAQKAMNRETGIALRSLWLSGTSSTTMNPAWSVEEVSQICREMNVGHILLLKDTDPDMVKVRTFDKDKYGERRLSIHDAVEVVASSRQEIPSTSKTDLAIPSKKEDRPATLESLIKVTVLSQEKLNALTRKRVETHVVTILKAPLLKCINDKLFVEVLAVDMCLPQVRYLAASLNVESDEKSFQTSVKELIEKTDSSSVKSYYETICDRVRQLVFENSVCAAFVIFGRKDSSYKIILCPANCRL